MKKLYSSLIVLFLSLSCFAQTTWDGSTDNDWADDTNWSAGEPTITDDVVIPNVTNDPELKVAASTEETYYAKSITIDENAVLTSNSASGSSAFINLIINTNIDVFNATCINLNNETDIELSGDTNSILTSADSIALPTDLRITKSALDDTVYINTSLNIAGNLNINETSVFVIASGEVVRIEGTLTNNGKLILDSAATLYCSGTLTNSDTITVLSHGQLTTASTVTNNGIINIKDDASYIQTNTAAASGTGDFRISRHLPDGQQGTPASYYTYWGSPVTSGSIGMSGGQMITATRTTIYKDGEDDNNDFEAGNYNSMTVGKGYGSYGITSTSDDGIVGGTFVGTPNNGNISYTLTYGTDENGVDADDDDFHYNFVANPYPSAISAEGFIDHNANTNNDIFGTIYIFSQSGAKASRQNLDGEADYIAVNLSGSTAPTGVISGLDSTITTGVSDFHIASCQGFMVIARDPGASTNTVTDFFQNSMRISGDNDNFKSGLPSDPILYRFWIELDDETHAKSSLLAFSDEATTGEDILYDAPNYYLNQYVDVWTESKGKQYEIQCLPRVEEVTEFIPLGVKSSKSGIHHLTLSNLTGWPANQAVYLFDQKQGLYHDLKNGTYDFYLDEDEKDRPISNRFYLTFIGTGTVGVNDIEDNTSIQIIASNNQIHISSSQSDIEKIEVIDTMGRVLLSQNGNGNNMTIEKKFGNQNCIVKVALANGEFKTQLFK